MTGFGLGEAALAPIAGGPHAGGGKLCVEIRSVNHRFCDVRVRVPRELGDLASFVEQLARERFTRGRFEIAVRVEGVALGAAVLDRERARAAYTALCTLRDELAPKSEVPLAMLASIPDLFVPGVEREIEAVRAALRKAFDGAVAALDSMRRREGDELAKDLCARLETVRTLARQVKQRSPEVVEGQKKRLRDRAERLRLAADLGADGVRLEQEIALFAERIDICEELTRLGSHCDHFSSLLAGEDAVGRRLDFLLQEMAREANTVGSKSPDAPIAHAIVDIKAEIERMREQVQNVE
jgi:uncharacterized protein (TIGR00255 family)